jgi:ABC-type dipeptide/oligopeptide/nickel transport system permease subunit
LASNDLRNGGARFTDSAESAKPARTLRISHLGRDVLSRVVFGTRVSLIVGFAAVLGPSFPTLILVVGLSGRVAYARIIRAQVLVLRSRELVDAIHGLGGSVARPRHATADAVLGRHGPRRPRVPRLRLVDLDGPRPGLMSTSLVVSRTGDWLRDVLDPTLRGE